MIIQNVIKGIPGLDDPAVNDIFQGGITCNWWRNSPSRILRYTEVPNKLTQRNLDWHQNSYNQPDPTEGGTTFSINTPFISTTAGTMDRSVAKKTNILTPAWKVALYFATDRWMVDGWLFYCHLFVIGKQAVALTSFAEELRELNIYTGFSPNQPEGEITAKIVIPAAQIERADFWSLSDAQNAAKNGSLPSPARTINNPNFVAPGDYNNLRALLL